MCKFVDARIGWLVLGRSAAYRTVDGGRTWRLSLHCNRYLYFGGLSFGDARHGHAVCGGGPATIMQWREYFESTDGGRTWRRVASAIYSGYVSGLAYPTPTVGFQSAERGGVERLDTGRLLLDSDDLDSALSMSWPDSRHGVVVLLHSGVVRTDDGGRHWRRIWAPGRRPWVAAFSSRKHGLGATTMNDVIARAGEVDVTNDGGRTWRYRGRIPDTAVTALTIAPGGLVWAAGGTGHDEGTLAVYRSDDEGRTWRVGLRTGTPAGAQSMWSPTERDLFVAGGRDLLRSRDGGRTWTVRPLPAETEAVAFGTRAAGLAVTYHALYRTGDGGDSWRRVDLPIEGFAPLDVTMLGAEHWWVRAYASVLRTDDGGRHWTRITQANPIVGRFLTPNEGVAALGLVYRTRDAGRTWRFVPPGTP